MAASHTCPRFLSAPVLISQPSSLQQPRAQTCWTPAILQQPGISPFTPSPPPIIVGAGLRDRMWEAGGFGNYSKSAQAFSNKLRHNSLNIWQRIRTYPQFGFCPGRSESFLLRVTLLRICLCGLHWNVLPVNMPWVGMQSRVQIANAIAIIMCDKLNYITSSSDQFVDEIRDRDENKSPATVSLYHL